MSVVSFALAVVFVIKLWCWTRNQFQLQ